MESKRLFIFIIIGILLIVTGIVYFKEPVVDNSSDNFDPSIYFEGEPVTQEEIDSVLSPEEQQEIDRIYNKTNVSE